MLNITQEIEFGRKVESMAIWYKSIVPLILWFDIINGQFVDPKSVKKLFRSQHYQIHATYLIFKRFHLPICVIFILASGLTSTPFLNQVPLTFSSDTSHLKTAWSFAFTVRSAILWYISSSFSTESEKHRDTGSDWIKLPRTSGFRGGATLWDNRTRCTKTMMCQDDMAIIYSSVRCSLSLCCLSVLYLSNRHKENSQLDLCLKIKWEDMKNRCSSFRLLL